MQNKRADLRKYAKGDRVTVITVFAEEQAQPVSYLFKHGEVTEPTDKDGWTRVKVGKSKNELGYFFKPHQLVPVNDGVVFAAMMEAIRDFQTGMELETALARNGFRLIKEG